MASVYISDVKVLSIDQNGCAGRRKCRDPFEGVHWFQLLPGEHTLTFELRRPYTALGFPSFRFAVQPGETYEIRSFAVADTSRNSMSVGFGTGHYWVELFQRSLIPKTCHGLVRRTVFLPRGEMDRRTSTKSTNNNARDIREIADSAHPPSTPADHLPE